MKKLFDLITTVFTLVLITFSLSSPAIVNAADIRTGENVIVSGNETNVRDLYLFGSDIQVNAPVTNDVVAAGGTINLSSPISNSVMLGGGTITLHGKVGNTARIAGGNITIDGPIKNDLVVAGGNVTISKNATIGGDLVIAGGQINVDGPIHGKVIMTGGDIVLNSAIGGSVTSGEVKTLTLGPQANIAGDLSYSSAQEATRQSGSIVAGQTSFHKITKPQHPNQQVVPTILGAAVYKLVIDIILSLLLIYFFRKGLLVLFARMQEAPWRSLGIGFVYAILAPLASLLLLILLWLGFASFFLYGFVLIVSLYLTKAFVGWWILTWWQRRNKHTYELDWQAGVLGPLVFIILSFIPIIGWLISAVICLIAIGALVERLISFVPQLQGAKK
jgi:hypothetical protein